MQFFIFRDVFILMNTFFDLHIHSESESLERLLRVTSRYGYSYIAVLEEDERFTGRRTQKEAGGKPQLLRGVEIQAKDVAELHKKIRKYRRSVDILAVRSGDDAVNRAALKDSRVDFLAHIEGGDELNHVAMRYAAESGVAVEFNAVSIINSRRGSRSRILQRASEMLKLARKYDASIILTSGARTLYELRAPRELMAVARLFGMEREEALKALTETPLRVLRRKEERVVRVMRL